MCSSDLFPSHDTLRYLLVSEDDVVHTAVFAEVVHGLAGIDFDDLF